MHDFVIVGSGATGLAAALALSERGKKALVLEAGPEVDARRDIRKAADLGSSGPTTSNKRWAVAHTEHLYVDDAEYPYESPADRPFCWVRGRQVGGRLQTWGRVALRMTDRELHASARDGLGADWPISYADLAPHYTRMERFLRVCGMPDGGDVIPDGTFGAPLPPGPGEDAFRAAIERLAPGQRVLTGRLALTTPTAMLREVKKAGLVTVRPSAAVTRIEARGGRATGLVIFDASTRKEEIIEARTILLAASAIDSVRILASSNLGNSSGTLGQYLMDHLTVLACGVHTKGPFDDSLDAALAGGAYCHVPSLVPTDSAALARSFGVQITLSRGLPRTVPRMFERMVDEARTRRAVAFWMQAFGQVLPRAENRVTLTDRVDASTARIPRIDMAYDDREKALAAHMTARMREMANEAGFEVLYDDLEALRPGTSVHEMGGARMGTSPETSVVRSDNRMWDLENVYVVDGACWPASPWQNPTLTMMAIAHRAASMLE